jgi:hypothetical protein
MSGDETRAVWCLEDYATGLVLRRAKREEWVESREAARYDRGAGLIVAPFASMRRTCRVVRRPLSATMRTQRVIAALRTRMRLDRQRIA